MGGGPAGSQRRLTYGGLQQLPVLAGAVLWSRAIPLLLKLVLLLFNECALGAAYPVERDLVVVTADVFQFTYCPVVQRGHLQDYLLGVLETPLEVRERQFCSGGQCVRVGDCVRIEMSKPSTDIVFLVVS